MRKPWNQCNKPYWLAREFMNVQGKPFTGPSGEFFKLYNFFKKLPDETLNLFHEYLQAVTRDRNMTMKKLFYAAPAWNQQRRMTVVTETKTDDYLKLLREWK